jgi:hypothetical protein
VKREGKNWDEMILFSLFSTFVSSSFLLHSSLFFGFELTRFFSAGESRAILAKALISNSKVVRYLATRHMRVLLRAGVSMYYDWGVTLLVQQV